MTWMIDGGPEGYQTGNGSLNSELPTEKSVFKQTESFEPLKHINTTTEISKPVFDKMELGEMKGASYFQAITFNVLCDKMKLEAERGNSQLLLDHSLYRIGNAMVDVLKEKGFSVSYINTSNKNYTVISW